MTDREATKRPPSRPAIGGSAVSVGTLATRHKGSAKVGALAQGRGDASGAADARRATDEKEAAGAKDKPDARRTGQQAVMEKVTPRTTGPATPSRPVQGQSGDGGRDRSLVDAKAERLSAALRANLARRKAQARARAGAGAGAGVDADAEAHGRTSTGMSDPANDPEANDLEKDPPGRVRPGVEWVPEKGRARDAGNTRGKDAGTPATCDTAPLGAAKET